MRELGLTGYLKQAVRDASSGRSGAIRALAREAEAGNAALLHPLVLLAATTDRVRMLEAEATLAGPLRPEIDAVSAVGGPDAIVASLEVGEVPGSCLSSGYHAVWSSFVARRSRTAAADAEKERLRTEVIVPGLDGQGITVYRLAKDLGINQGAAWDFVRRGTANRLGPDSVSAMAEYVTRAGVA